MRRFLICTGVLGGGTAVTFAAAAFAASLLPGGTVVPGNPVMVERGWVKGPAIEVPIPEPIPPDIEEDLERILVEDAATSANEG